LFHLIIRMMRQGQDTILPATGYAGKKGVAQLARRHFDGEFALVGEAADIGAANINGTTHFSGNSADEIFVSIAGPAAELVVKVDDGELPAVLRG
jgi:hypothetical protein